jgi:DNA-binding NarL/FixJ family response regulator
MGWALDITSMRTGFTFEGQMNDIQAMLLQRGLTFRQAEVASLVCEGRSNKYIAQKLFVEEKTVKDHLTAVYETIHVRSRLELAVWCLKRLPPPAVVEDPILPMGSQEGFNV